MLEVVLQKLDIINDTLFFKVELPVVVQVVDYHELNLLAKDLQFITKTPVFCREILVDDLKPRTKIHGGGFYTGIIYTTTDQLKQVLKRK